MAAFWQAWLQRHAWSFQTHALLPVNTAKRDMIQPYPVSHRDVFQGGMMMDSMVVGEGNLPQRVNVIRNTGKALRDAHS